MVDRDFSVGFKVVSERNWPFYSIENLFVLTSQSVQFPLGHPSCLILVREVTNLLFSSIVPALGNGFEELKRRHFSCGGCTGLIKFQIEDDPANVDQADAVLSPLESQEEEANRFLKKSGEKLSDVVINGQLSEISPSELMQFFHMHQKTDKLFIEVTKGTGMMAFREGGIIGANFMEYENEEAVFALLREQQGKFSFYNGIPDSLIDIEEIGDFMMLLMEGIKLMDESGG